MNDELCVLLNGVAVGALRRERAGRLRFVYDDGYRRDPAATPLSLSMPLAVAEHTHATISPWLTGLLPDNPDVLRRWGRQFGVAAIGPYQLLATPIGEDCAGAVQFVRPSRLDDILASPGTIEWLREADVEARLRALREDETTWLGDPSRGPSFLGQFSLAGRQRKTALLFEKGRWGVPTGRIPTTHIVKPPIARLDDYALHEQEVNEHLCLAAARRAGLAAADTSVMTFGAERAIVVTRYDRRQAGDQWIRVHQEDLCQALAVPPERKYERDGGPGLARIAALFRKVLPASAVEHDIMRFADGVAWNWILAGTDAHAKNYSILLSGRGARLAPLYDITSGLPYWRDHDLAMAMKLDDGYEMHNHVDPWPDAAIRLGVDTEALRERVLHLCAVAPDALADVAADPAIVALGGRLPARLTRHVATRARWAARLLGASSTRARDRARSPDA